MKTDAEYERGEIISKHWNHYYIFKKIEKLLNMLSRDMHDIKKSQIKNFKIKNKTSEIKE